jgi:hypothetical protein
LKHELAVLALWLIAIIVTLMVLDGEGFTFLGPLYAICMIGSVVTVRNARNAPRR